MAFTQQIRDKTQTTCIQSTSRGLEIDPACQCLDRFERTSPLELIWPDMAPTDEEQKVLPEAHGRVLMCDFANLDLFGEALLASMYASPPHMLGLVFPF